MRQPTTLSAKPNKPLTAGDQASTPPGPNCSSMTMDERIEHLKMIQLAVTRMANNSFLIKGWAVTLVAALFALAAAEANENFVLIALVPTLAFWFLDTYYLRQERLFRALFDAVRDPKNQVDFSLSTNPSSSPGSSYPRVGFSATLLAFYGGVLVSIAIAYWLGG